ncbi:hypothetical protein D3C73_858640 [compost metagenome]
MADFWNGMQYVPPTNTGSGFPVQGNAIADDLVSGKTATTLEGGQPKVISGNIITRSNTKVNILPYWQESELPSGLYKDSLIVKPAWQQGAANLYWDTPLFISPPFGLNYVCSGFFYIWEEVGGNYIELGLLNFIDFAHVTDGSIQPITTESKGTLQINGLATLDINADGSGVAVINETGRDLNVSYVVYCRG